MRLQASLQASRMLYARGRNPTLQESTQVGHLLLPWHLLGLTRIVAQCPWLGKTDDGNLKALLIPYPADQKRMWEISARVNSPKNDDPSLWESIHAEQAQTTTDALELLPE
jgi:hypothetical protein